MRVALQAALPSAGALVGEHIGWALARQLGRPDCRHGCLGSDR